jgi:hypothetical protein
MAQEGDDEPMMMMLEECEQTEKEELAPPEPTMEIVTLVEEKVYLHDKRGSRRVRMSGASTRARAIT